MLMGKLSRPAILLLLACVAFSLSAFPARAAVHLSGTVKSSSGEALEGVAVSTRAAGKTYTTTVYSDREGRYEFPALDSGAYRVWAQAVGFRNAEAQVELAAGSKQVPLTLKKTDDYERQLTGPELMTSFGDGSASDRRMKEILVDNCTGCHQSGFILQNRFDERGWGVIIQMMERFTAIGYTPPGAKPSGAMQAYKDELASYLAKVRGPDSPPPTLRPYPRPSGEATRIVITEFDLTRPDRPPGWVMPHNGSDWWEGIPSRYEGRAPHDVVVDEAGNVWFADDSTPDRTLGELDPRTGQVTDYKFPDDKNNAVSTHTLLRGPDGIIWASSESLGAAIRFDPETKTFRKFDRPAGIPPATGFLAQDAEGNLWAPNSGGMLKLDAKRGKFTQYATVTHGKSTYDVAVDREDQVWVAQPTVDKLAMVDARTGKASELVLKLVDVARADATARDQEITAHAELGSNNGTPLLKGPRRLAADPNADLLWAAEYFGNALLKVEIKTRKVTEYPLPHRYSQPYSVAVDKNHNVWLTLMNQDRIAKFNPKTEKFTEYQMPTRGTESRQIYANNRTDPPTIWVPYNRTNKIARIQFLSTKPGSNSSAR